MDAPKAQHPADQTLRDYAVGKLDNTTAESVNKHLELCPPCRRRVGELTSDSFLGRLRDAQPQPDSHPPPDLLHRRSFHPRRRRESPSTASGEHAASGTR